MSRARTALTIAITMAAAAGVGASGESDALRARAADFLYNLDRDQALTVFRQAVEADPKDAAAYRGMATALWLSITFRRGNMTVDDYVGRVTKPTASPVTPPPETVSAFNDALGKAIALAHTRIDANPKDAAGHYDLGSAVGLRASYLATVDGSALGAFRSAREAYEEHEKVLELDPKRKDAGLIVGTYRYIVSALALPLRWVAYMAGFGGGKDKGLRLIEDAAAYGGDNQTDARFALILLYNREKRYDDALKQLGMLREQYPRNRLMWLESGSTNLRAGRPADALKFLDEGMARFQKDQRPRMFGEDALWHYKRGAARAGVGKASEAHQDLADSLALEGRKWVHGRAHLELGRLALKAGHRDEAVREFQAAAKLCDEDNDPGAAEEARRLMK